MPNIARRHFRAELLPIPSAFYERELGRLSRPSRGWASCQCPFCDSQGGKRRRGRSSAFAVNLTTGGFNCFKCGAKGDMLTFVMLRDRLDFKHAAQTLGAWDESPSDETLRKIEQRQREREAQKQREAEDHAHLLSLRDNLLMARRLYREIPEQLQNSGAADAWHLLALLHDYTRELDMEYCAFAGLEYAE